MATTQQDLELEVYELLELDADNAPDALGIRQHLSRDGWVVLDCPDHGLEVRVGHEIADALLDRVRQLDVDVSVNPSCLRRA